MDGRPIPGNGRSSAAEAMATLSLEARSFILYVLTPNLVFGRPTAETILKHPFMDLDDLI